MRENRGTITSIARDVGRSRSRAGPRQWSEAPEPEPGKRRRLSAAAGRARPEPRTPEPGVTTHPAQRRLSSDTQESLASVRARPRSMIIILDGASIIIMSSEGVTCPGPRVALSYFGS